MARTKQNRTRSVVKLKDVNRRILVERDESGVPHISGDRWLDVLYGLGYLHALDRGTQILFSRVVAQGTAAERIADKSELVETDRFFRRIGLDLQLKQEVVDLDDDVREQIENYCQGVSDGVQAAGRFASDVGDPVFNHNPGMPKPFSWLASCSVLAGLPSVRCRMSDC